jgi:hypothetical protein
LGVAASESVPKLEPEDVITGELTAETVPVLVGE